MLYRWCTFYIAMLCIRYFMDMSDGRGGNPKTNIFYYMTNNFVPYL